LPPRKEIMIMAGGTGGHVYPALAVADYLRDQGVPLFWLGAPRGIENRVVPAHGIELLTVKVSGVRGKDWRRKLMAPLTILGAIAQALRICRQRRPAAALGMGGFASGPGAIAAWLLRIPLLIHEQNRVAGTTNRILSRFAVKIMQGFPGTFRDSAKVITTGNPVRRAIVDLSAAPSGGSAARGQSNITLGRGGAPGRAEVTPTPAAPTRAPAQLNVLVLGGSQGARQLNRLAPRGLNRLQHRLKVNVWHQCGARHVAETQRVYAGLQLDQPRIDPFITDMAAAYSWADIAVCRAGALTIAELCAAGLPSILVPLPHAIDDHQRANASYLCDAGAAVLLPESELTETAVAELLWQLCGTNNRLSAMAQQARQCAFPAAAQAVGSLCLEYAHA